MESSRTLSNEYDRLEKLASEIKKTNIDNYKIGNYCDALDETKNWCVGEVIDRQNDQLKVHFEGWSSKHDIPVFLGKVKKTDHFRKFTKGYSGQKLTAYRTLTFTKEDFLSFKNFIKELKENFKILSNNINILRENINTESSNYLNLFANALDITQNLRGKAFFKLDYFMTNPFNNQNLKEMGAEIVEILYDYLEIVVYYLKFYQENIQYTEILRKFPDLFLADKLCSIIASLYEMLLTLKRIFGRDDRVNYIYKQHFETLKEVKYRENKNKICKKKFYGNMQQDRLAHFAIASFIDYFNELQGFKIIFDIILNQSESLIPNGKPFYLHFDFLQNFMDLLENINFYVNLREAFAKEMNSLKDNISDRISNLSEIEIKEIDKITIENIARSLKNILDPEEKQLIFDILNLNFHLKCINSKSLPKRIKGITEINNIIQKLETREKSTISNAEQRDQYDEYNISLPSLFGWIKKNNFLDIFFGENIHEEILKRCINILKLYAKNDLLDLNLIDNIWRLSMEKHEAISVQIQNIFCQLCRFLKKSDRDYIYNKILNIPKSKFDQETLNFAKTFCKTCILISNHERSKKANQVRMEDSNEYGIALMIKYSMDEVDREKNDISIIDNAIDHLKDLFGSIAFSDEIINQFLFDLIERIKKGNSIIQCYKIIANLIDTINESVFTSEKKYEFLETKCSFLDLIIQDLKRYMIKSIKIRNSSQELQSKNNPINVVSSLNQEFFSTIFEGFYNHRTNIELRLNFIKYIFPLLKDFSNKDLYYHITNLWDIFFDTDFYERILLETDNANKSSNKMEIENDYNNRNFIVSDKDSKIPLITVRDEEKNLFLTIFNDNNDGSLSRFSNVTARHLFKNILINENKFNPKKININAFKTFTKFFYVINISENKLLNLRGRYLVKDFELHGQDFIWNILVNTNKNDVRNEAASLIVNNSLNLLKYSIDFSNKIWSNFISKLLLHFNDCMEKYNLEYKNNRNEYTDNDGNGVKGLLLLIRKLLEKIDDQYITAQDEVIINDIGYEVQFRLPSKNQQKIFKIDKNETIYDLRAKISYFFDIPILNVGLKNQRRNLIISSNDDATLAFELIDRNSSLEILILPNPILKINENPKNLILENKFIFDSLFSLLRNSECEFINDAWELINIMPKNKELENRIIDLGNKLFKNSEKEFCDCFDTTSLYHLSYSIQILKQILNDNNIEKWINNFLKNNGKIFLINVLINLKQPFNRKNLNGENIDDPDSMHKPDHESGFIFSPIYLQLILDILNIIERISDFISDKINEDEKKVKQGNFDNNNSINKSKAMSTNVSENANVDNSICKFGNKNQSNINADLIDLLIQNLFRIIYEILISSHNNDNNPKYLNLQKDFLKKKLREIMIKNYNNKTDETIDTLHPDMEHIHEEIRAMWLLEDKAIAEICRFLQNNGDFSEENIVKNIIYNNELKMKNETINSPNKNLAIDNLKGNMNYFSLVLKKGLIIPKNFKAKFTIWDFFEKLILFTNQDPKNRDLLFCYVYNNIFSKETLLYCVNHSESLAAFSKIVSKILSYNLISQEFVEKNKNNLLINFENIVEYILSLIDNLSEFKTTTTNNTMNTISEEQKNDDDIYEYLFSILRELTLNNDRLNEYLLKSRNMLNYILNECLFSNCRIIEGDENENKNLNKIEDHNNKQNKLKNNNSKSAAFGLLSSLSYDNNNYVKQILKNLIEYHKLGFWRSKRNSEWNKFSAADQKSQTGYVGLENLGCTCYMNSLLQQFFNIDFIREGILACPDNSLISLDESYLYQLKNIFAFLKATDRKFHNPKDFTNIFKNYDNQIMNVTEQMDVDEFYNLLIDRLEPYMKTTKFENLFKFVFSGIISNEIIGKNGCPHFSETKEPFQSVIIQVKNKKNIEESLDAFIQGEMMEGDNSYNCEKCEKKVSALKRQCFKKLPRVLVLVLKRFEYDYETMQKNKINDYCEFPLELNMEKYTQEFLMKKDNEQTNNESENTLLDKNIMNSEYLFDLTGVIIHTGTTERGHYYSFAKKGNSQWLEFNDTNVTPFNLEDLEDEAFGGSQYFFNNKTGKNELMEKSTNAYVLLYTRKDVVKLQEEAKFAMEIDCSNSKTTSFERDSETENLLKILRSSSKYSNVQENIIENIKTDNFQYWVSKMIFSNEYIQFVKDIILNYNSHLSEIYTLHMLSKNEFNNMDYQDFLKVYETRLKETFDKEKNLNISTMNKSGYFNPQDTAVFKATSIINASVNQNNPNYNILNSSTKNSILTINYGTVAKLEKYIYENARVKRFKKAFNLQDSLNPELKINNVEFYYKKLADVYAYNTNINKDLLISNIKRNKKAFSLSFKSQKSISANKANNCNDSENNFNLIPDESEIQLPLENTYESSNLKNKTNPKSNSHVIDLLSAYQKENLKFDLFKFLCTFFFTTVLRCKDKNLMISFVEIMKIHLNLSVENAVWLLEEFSNFDLIQEFLIECPTVEIKRITSGIIFTSLLKICRSNNTNESNSKTVNDFVIIDKNDLQDNLEKNTSCLTEENPLDTVNNFIKSLLQLVSKKSKFPFKDFNTINFILWRFSTIGYEQRLFLLNFGLVKFIVANLKLRNKFECSVNLEDCMTLNVRPPKHSDLVNKKPIKNEKLSVLEELMEKKQMERLNTSSDNYLTLTLFEILSSSDYSKQINLVSKSQENIANKMDVEAENLITTEKEKIINLNEDIIRFINFEDKDHLRMYAFEANKTRQSNVYFNNLLCKFCFNNEEFSNRLFESFYELYTNLDFDELTCISRPFRTFISINDNLADIRIKNYFKRYLTLTTEHFKFFKYTEMNIDNIINIFYNQLNAKRILGHLDKLKEILMKFYRWLKQNPIAPIYCNSKETVYFRKRANPNQNLTPNEIQQYQNLYQKLSEENATKLSKIITNNLKEILETPKINSDPYKSDFLEFEFSIGDVAKIELNKNECKVLCVLEDLIFVEYTSDANIQKKLVTINKWLETDKISEIIELKNFEEN